MTSTLSSADQAVFDLVARRHLPGADRALPLLSRSANHGVLWLTAAGAVAVWARGKHPKARRAAVRGTASLALASATVNTVAKWSVRRSRPLLDTVPLVRRLKRQPITTSFPSGHSASAAAFVAGMAMESRTLGAALAPVAGAVAFSRVYTGVHYPSDVVAGAALGVGAAYAVRKLFPVRTLAAPRARVAVDVPALPDGKGLVVVVNAGSGTATATSALAEVAMPRADFVHCDPADGRLLEELEQAARRASELRGALGVCGGDGTVNAAARMAVRFGVPLAVLPGGTLNHFALDLGIEEVQDAAAALNDGEAVKVDLGRFSTDGSFLNTFALGAYPELVRIREHWSPRIGGWPAGVLAAFRVLRDYRPIEIRMNGERHQVWLLFAGNCRYDGLGLTPQRRSDLSDGLLDVRVAHAGQWARTRLLLAALAGTLEHSPVHGMSRVRRLRIDWIQPGTQMAFDGEVTEAPGKLRLDKQQEALVVYCPLSR
ncbi:phosphatase PAP2 family protein [Streptomyces sp. 549]|uniref:bifunctional phosphatase PAP2/diacylglycerol kinase family protein n=1 Tax=Streptomyces sp. 549 TaxID=3049076 RepID=UPI0024C46AFD|nr:phosphatase PAP2 family protein [Streptomyces sp. 549]MDK1472123.1 phosphatase PAP2 family protein [Streptomyces sp. 549]